MKNEKSMIQRLQSRISQRRNSIAELDQHIHTLLCIKVVRPLSEDFAQRLTALRGATKVLGHDQRLDKELYQMLLAKRGEIVAKHFYSKYPPASSGYNLSDEL